MGNKKPVLLYDGKLKEILTNDNIDEDALDIRPSYLYELILRLLVEYNNVAQSTGNYIMDTKLQTELQNAINTIN